MGQTHLILASKSPRRSGLLSQLGLSFDVEEAAVDERHHSSETASAYVERLARAKAERIAVRHPNAIVLGADTAIEASGRILGKPENEEDARTMLGLLSGRSHQVLTGVCVRAASELLAVVTTEVSFRALRTEEIQWYVRTGEPLDKAGAYAIQGIGAMFIRSIQGSPTNVIGLPLVETSTLLKRAGVAFPWEPSG